MASDPPMGMSGSARPVGRNEKAGGQRRKAEKELEERAGTSPFDSITGFVAKAGVANCYPIIITVEVCIVNFSSIVIIVKVISSIILSLLSLLKHTLLIFLLISLLILLLLSLLKVALFIFLTLLSLSDCVANSSITIIVQINNDISVILNITIIDQERTSTFMSTTFIIISCRNIFISIFSIKPIVMVTS